MYTHHEYCALLLRFTLNVSVSLPSSYAFFLFLFTATAATDIYTLPLPDALPISAAGPRARGRWLAPRGSRTTWPRSEEHTSELQSRRDIVCRLLLEKKKKTTGMDTRIA